ncbi:MAG: hypothetical protein SFW09_10940 [Hyphomicrobiaceae bacterium]|nr:hypothetical protein [Hyphomicrobiaceae bacterium]
MKLMLAALATAVSLSVLATAAGATGTSAGTAVFTEDQSAPVVDRRRPRVPGGSGCDDPEDILEHPECR